LEMYWLCAPAGNVPILKRLLKLIIEAIEKTQDNQTKAAEILGISERMLRYKLKKYALKH